MNVNFLKNISIGLGVKIGRMKKIKQVIILRNDIGMTSGKMCAQAAHASIAVILNRMNSFRFFAFANFTKQMLFWMKYSFTKVVVTCDSEEELIKYHKLAKSEKIPTSLIFETEYKKPCKVCRGSKNLIVGFDKVPITEPCYACDGKGYEITSLFTAAAIGPDYSDEIDKITKELRLL